APSRHRPRAPPPRRLRAGRGGGEERDHAAVAEGRVVRREGEVAHVPREGRRARDGVGPRLSQRAQARRRDDLQHRVDRGGDDAQGRVPLPAEVLRLRVVLAQRAGHVSLAGAPHRLRRRDRGLQAGGTGRPVPRPL
ncbi:MAG: hypothetical protein AVDCRST_MAG85-4280, partial [uncultured Solirubrobacteraceae bacterium]